MSAILYMRSKVSFAEKNTWLWTVIGVAVPGAYLFNVLSQLRTTAAVDIAYQQPMLVSIGVTIVLSILASVVVAASSPRNTREDQRDKEIYRFGEYAGYWLLTGGMIAALGMAMLKADYFWIANTLYASGALAALVGSVVKIASYRLGLRGW
jgi:hypothetical protein